MPFNDNQLFYATLYWAEALPGGEAFSNDICTQHGKPYMPMNPPLQTADRVELDPFKHYYNSSGTEEMSAKNIEQNIKAIVESGVTRDQFNAFFEAMYSFLTQHGEMEQLVDNWKDGEYIELSRRLPHSNRDAPFSNAIIYGLSAAGLDSEILNPKAEIYAHDNGQLFAMPRTGKNDRDIINVAYPGCPDAGRSLPGISTEDGVAATSMVSIEHLYRAVELEAGKTYARVHIEPEGHRIPFNFIAGKGDLYYFSNRDVGGDLSLLSRLTDEELMSGQDVRVSGGMRVPADEKGRYAAGYVDEGYTVEATGNPRIVSLKQAPVRCMEVTGKTQIGYGNKFYLAEPGDKIIFRGGGVMVLRKEDLESGRCRLVTVKNSPAAKPGVRRIMPTPG